MTLRNAYEFILIECNKLKAPSILVEDFVYLFNKSIQQYINTIYNRAEYNQQSSDDIGFLQTTTVINASDYREEFGDKTYQFTLPKDYMHMLNCIAEFSKSNHNNTCNKTSSKIITSSCRRLTADLYPGILNNYYMKPSYKRPYYYIINRNSENYNCIDDNIKNGSYSNKLIEVEIDGHIEYVWEQMKENGSRISNQSDIKMDIHCGQGNWDLNKVYVTYLKSPRYVSMTYDQVLQANDTTDVLEFPDYVCYEIINICTRLLLENASDPRLTTHIPINQSVMNTGE